MSTTETTASQAADRISEALDEYERLISDVAVTDTGFRELVRRRRDALDNVFAECSVEALRALLAERDELVKDAAGLREALLAVSPFVATEVVESCNGNKCREIWCAGCCGQESASEAIAAAFDGLAKARAALTKDQS